MKFITFASLSIENLKNNFNIIKSYTCNETEILAMVKANAYGHCMRSVARYLSEWGVSKLGVARIEEGLALRKIGIKTPIVLCEGVFSQEQLVIAAVNNFEIAFHHESQISLLDNSNYLPSQVKIWFKINTGMNRLGFSMHDQEVLHNQFKRIKNNEYVQKEIVIMSHFACSGEKEHPMNATQISKFNNFCESLQGESIKKSLCNSAGIFNFPNQHYDYVRPGLALYGYSSICAKHSKELGLKPVMTLCAHIIAINHAVRGEFIGYSCTFQCPNNMKIGIVSIGYGDGYSRCINDGAYVILNQKKCYIVGRVSMDMLAVDLTDHDDAQIGDLVILFGAHGLGAEDLEEKVNLISYNILTNVQNRVKYYWV